MAEGLNALFGIFKGFITAITEFWNWFINPIIDFGGVIISPIGIFSFATFIIVFTMILIHLFNPIN